MAVPLCQNLAKAGVFLPCPDGPNSPDLALACFNSKPATSAGAEFLNTLGACAASDPTGTPAGWDPVSQSFVNLTSASERRNAVASGGVRAIVPLYAAVADPAHMFASWNAWTQTGTLYLANGQSAPGTGYSNFPVNFSPTTPNACYDPSDGTIAPCS